MAVDDVPSQKPQSQRRGVFPPEIMALAGFPLKVGAWSGAAGTLAGIGGGISQDAPLAISGMLTGVQWFALGTSYTFTRMMISRSRGGEDRMTPPGKMAMSAVAGSVAGSFAGLLRGPRQIIPNILLWGGIGAFGEYAAQALVKYKPWPKSFNDNWMESKWSPLRKISNEEYDHMLSEKILAIDADLELIDERIAELRRADKKAQEEGKSTAESKTTR